MLLLIVTVELITTRIIYSTVDNHKYRLVIFGNVFLLFTPTCASRKYCCQKTKAYITNACNKELQYYLNETIDHVR